MPDVEVERVGDYVDERGCRIINYLAGNRVLRLQIDPSARVAETDVSSWPSGKKVEGQTTAMYREAYNDLVMIASQLGPIEFRFKARTSRNMSLWARSEQKGKGIFKWEEEFLLEPAGIFVQYFARATIDQVIK